LGKSQCGLHSRTLSLDSKAFTQSIEGEGRNDKVLSKGKPDVWERCRPEINSPALENVSQSQAISFPREFQCIYTPAPRRGRLPINVYINNINKLHFPIEKIIIGYYTVLCTIWEHVGLSMVNYSVLLYSYHFNPVRNIHL
jgi:hypothetical protein